MAITLPSFYLPPISWFAAYRSGEQVVVDIDEMFRKQTLRNRCYIDSPNGKLALSIPIDKSNFDDRGKCIMRDVMLSKQLNWQHQHWYAFESSYFNSPFFEYLQDDFRPFYEKEWKYLVDLNEALTSKCLELLELNTPTILPAAKAEARKTYYQVFQHKHGFIEDLSILDLLFNMGPEAPLYL